MIIFGLGNPGLKYRSTRHNAGFILIDRFARAYRKRLSRKQGYSWIELTLGRSHAKITLVKPLMFMNRSGVIVSKIVEEQLEEFLVVVDDINLPLGKIRLRNRGSDGGHLGLRSIIQALHTENFSRLRIGIGRPEETPHPYPLHQGVREVQGIYSDYVLRPFGKNEKKILISAIDQAIIGIEMLATGGFEKAQNRINSVNVTNKSEARNTNS